MRTLINKIIKSKMVKQSFDDLMYARTDKIRMTIESDREIYRKTVILVISVIEAVVE